MIVAGGKASRLGGRIKALLDIDGRTMLDRLLDVLAPRFAALAISANDALPFASHGLPVLADQIPDQGPLAGILSALQWCRESYLLVVPCDMPFLDGRIVDLLLARRAPGVDAIVPFVNDLPEPLLALYHQRCTGALAARLQQGKYKASGLVTDEGLNVYRVQESEIRAVDPHLDCLTNINSQADLERAISRLRCERGVA